MDIARHFIRKLMIKGAIRVDYIASDEQLVMRDRATISVLMLRR